MNLRENYNKTDPCKKIGFLMEKISGRQNLLGKSRPKDMHRPVSTLWNVALEPI